MLLWQTPSPQEVALRAIAPTPTYTSPFISSLPTPTPTKTNVVVTPFPREPIFDPTEAYANHIRYNWSADRPKSPESLLSSDTTYLNIDSTASSGEGTPKLYFPLAYIDDSRTYLWYKGSGQAEPYSPPFFISTVDVSWWYDWHHEYPWGTPDGRMESSRYVPMIWCASLPGEIPGNLNDVTGAGLGLWNPDELRQKVLSNRGKVWLIFNEPDGPAVALHSNTLEYDQCANVLCAMANYSTLPPQATVPPNAMPTATPTFTPTPTPPPGATPTSTPLPKWPCSWPATVPSPAYQPTLEATMIRIAADRYAQIYEIIHTNDPTAKVFCCGNFYAGYSTWWPPFLHQLELYHPNVRINGIAIHAYPDHSSVGACNDWQGIENLIFSECMKTALTNAYNDLSGMNSPIIDANAPIWITETGVLTSAHILKTQQAIRDYYMRPLINWMQSGAGRYERIGWFISILDQQATTDRTGLFQYVPYNATPSVLSVLGSTWSTAKPATTPTP